MPDQEQQGVPGILKRPYGPDGIMLSVIGMGGIVIMDADQQQADRLVAEAVERGVNYFDVAPTYGDAELRLGPALSPYRDRVFLACKTTQRGRQGAEEELGRSLERLRTDHVDLYQLHGLADMRKDVDAAFAEGGAIEALIEAKRRGQVRYLGFSAHSEETALAAMERFDFDSVLYPVNAACWIKSDFGPRVIAEARARGLTVLALKAMASERWSQGDPERQRFPRCWYHPITDREKARQALRFTLSRPVTAALPPGDESMFRLALELVEGVTSFEAPDEETLQELVRSLSPIF